MITASCALSDGQQSDLGGFFKRVMAITPQRFTLTTSGPLPFDVGGRVVMPFDTNRVRRFVESKRCETECTVVTFLRPSRGFARHRRRVKAVTR